MSLSKTSEARSAGPELSLDGMMLLSDVSHVHATRHPDRIALVFDEHSWSYAAFDRVIDAAVTLFDEAGLEAGDRFAYFGKNSDLFFIIMIAAARAQLVMVPVNWRNTAAETAYILTDSGAKLILADREFEPLVGEACAGSIPCIVTDDPGEQGLRARLSAATPAPRRPTDPRAPFLQLYTSGTTGKPKGVLTSEYAISLQRRMEEISGHFTDWGDDEILLSPLPSFHVGGMSWVCCGFTRGITVVLTTNATPGGILDLCLKHGITRTFIVPTLVRALIGEMDARGVRIPTLRGIHYGAAPMDAALLERSVDRLGCRFLQYYGMTEITGAMTILGPADHDSSHPHLLRSVGRALPGDVIEIRDPDGELLAVDQPGEIWVKGPTLLIEYWNRPDATAEAMIDGWYRTGDGGRLDAQGYLYLTDRIKDMIVSGGENVYPAEVEAVLRDHPAILDCAVIGLPDPKWGEGVTAALELKPGETIDAQEVMAFARKSLAAYKIPRRVESGITLPRTASGKVQRGLVRKMFLDDGGN